MADFRVQCPKCQSKNVSVTRDKTMRWGLGNKEGLLVLHCYVCGFDKCGDTATAIVESQYAAWEVEQANLPSPDPVAAAKAVAEAEARQAALLKYRADIEAKRKAEEEAALREAAEKKAAFERKRREDKVTMYEESTRALLDGIPEWLAEVNSVSCTSEVFTSAVSAVQGAVEALRLVVDDFPTGGEDTEAAKKKYEQAMSLAAGIPSLVERAVQVARDQERLIAEAATREQERLVEATPLAQEESTQEEVSPVAVLPRGTPSKAPPPGTWAHFDLLGRKALLEDVTFSDLRKYARWHLNIVGVSKMHASKEDVVRWCLEARQKRDKIASGQ